MKIIYNSLIPFKGFQAINICGIVFQRKECKMDVFDYNHEYIHTLQQRELLFVGFYILYLLEWIFRLFQYKFDNSKAYHAISFEREAYANQSNLAYKSTRCHYAQWRT